jgi:PD-(D/E)XK nuclease superfamily
MQRDDERDDRGWRWSISRSSLLRSCPKAFRFSIGRAPLPGVRATRIGLSTLVGVTVHEAIRRELDKWANHRGVSARSAASFADDFLNRAWFAEDDGLIERANGLELDQSLLVRLETAARFQLDIFFRMVWPQFEMCRHEQHEVLTTFQANGFDLAAKVDLAAWDALNHLLVIDWKTSEWAGSRSDRAQLAFYTLWARVTLGLDLDSIAPILVRIRSGELICFRPLEADIQYVLELIGSDFESVSVMKARGDFPASPDQRKCSGCPFLRLCEDGKSVMGID